MRNMTKSQATTPIPVQLSGPEFIAFIFPHLSMPRRGPKCKLGYHRVFNLILWVLYTGMQWKCLPVPRAAGDGTAMIHYTTIYKVFAKWADDGSLDQAFIASVRHLAKQHHLDLSILHGDGSNTVAKKGGDGIGYSGHKHQKGEKVLAIVDNNGFVLAPLPVAPVNEADTVLLPDGLNALKRVARSDFDTLIQNTVCHQQLTARRKVLGTTVVRLSGFRLATDRVVVEQRVGSSVAGQRRRPGIRRRRSRARRHAGAASVRLGRRRFARSDRGHG